MAPKKIWFLPPDFTFLENGLIQLGTVIPHPGHPTRILLHPEELSTTTPPINLPPVQTLVETNHSHTDRRSNTIGGDIWGNFVEVASASLKLDTERTKGVEYGVVDHKVLSFARPFTMDTLVAIMAQPAVRNHMDSGLWGKRPVYIVSGLRITKMGMSVTTGQGIAQGGGISGSGPVLAGGVVPVELGAGIHGERRRDKTGSYETAAGIVFAYQVNIVRQRRGGNGESELFSHKTAFMTGGTEENMEWEVAELDPSILKDEQEEEEQLGFSEHKVGDTDVCVSFG